MTTMTTPTTQVYSVFILATPEQIWDAITKPEFTERYFHGARVEVRDGRRYSSVGDDLEWDEPVLEEDPPRRLVHSWIAAYDPALAAEGPSRVTWEIEPQEDGSTLLTVTHDRLEDSPKTAESVSGTGWMYVLSGLKTLLETGEPLRR
ncbi:MAG TPA: SRPBCC family protein [Gaiellaceae bacterium]